MEGGTTSRGMTPTTTNIEGLTPQSTPLLNCCQERSNALQFRQMVPTDRTLAAMQEFAVNHGNRLHARVVSLLRDNAWTVLVSPYYRDNATDKAREADIIAEREFPVTTGPFDRHLGSIRVRLVVECKYISEDTLCWFDMKDVQRSNELIVAGTPFKPSSEHIGIQSHHWYTISEVAKLFAARPEGKDRRKEPEGEVLFSAFDKVLNSLIYYSLIRTIIPTSNLSTPSLFPKSITVPVVIVNDFGRLYKTTIARPDVVECLAGDQWFVAEINYAHIKFTAGARFSMTEYFLADVVSFTALSDYLAMIGGAELDAMKSMLRQG